MKKYFKKLIGLIFPCKVNETKQSEETKQNLTSENTNTEMADKEILNIFLEELYPNYEKMDFNRLVLIWENKTESNPELKETIKPNLIRAIGSADIKSFFYKSLSSFDSDLLEATEKRISEITEGYTTEKLLEIMDRRNLHSPVAKMIITARMNELTSIVSTISDVEKLIYLGEIANTNGNNDLYFEYRLAKVVSENILPNVSLKNMGELRKLWNKCSSNSRVRNLIRVKVEKLLKDIDIHTFEFLDEFLSQTTSDQLRDLVIKRAEEVLNEQSLKTILEKFEKKVCSLYCSTMTNLVIKTFHEILMENLQKIYSSEELISYYHFLCIRHDYENSKSIIIKRIDTLLIKETSNTLDIAKLVGFYDHSNNPILHSVVEKRISDILSTINYDEFLTLIKDTKNVPEELKVIFKTKAEEFITLLREQ